MLEIHSRATPSAYVCHTNLIALSSIAICTQTFFQSKPPHTFPTTKEFILYGYFDHEPSCIAGSSPASSPPPPNRTKKRLRNAGMPEIPNPPIHANFHPAGFFWRHVGWLPSDRFYMTDNLLTASHTWTRQVTPLSPRPREGDGTLHD